MNFIKPVFYIIVAALCVYLAVAVYALSDGASDGADIGLKFTYVLGIAVVAASIIFPIVYMIQHPKSGVRALIGVAIIGVLFLISWAISGNEITPLYEKVGFTSASASQFVGGGLKMMYVMIAGVLGVTIFSEVRNIFK